MAVQDDLAAALSSIAAATTALNNIGGQATAAINQVTQAYTSRLNSMEVTFHVNQTTGSDDATGAAEAPLRSFKEALRRTPAGGSCTALLSSAYNQTERLSIANKSLRIWSTSAVRHPLTYDRTINSSLSPASRELAGYEITGCSRLALIGVRVVMPGLDGYSPNSDQGKANLFQTSFFNAGQTSISMLSCDFDVPTTLFAPIFADAWPVDFLVSFLTMVGAAGSLNGKLIGSQTSLSGASSASISCFRTNLATI